MTALAARVGAWARSTGAARWSRRLVVAGAAALPLQAAATLEVGFTLRLSYVLFALALAVGLPFAWRGFRRAPGWLRWPAVGLALLYALVTATGDLATIEGTSRAGTLRAFVYLGDIVLGAAVAFLVAGLWTSLRALRPLLLGATAGAGVAAAYVLWQWPAQRFGWPLSDVVPLLSSAESRDQGAGLLGWERPRGTFLEPHFLGAFMSAATPLALVAAAHTRGMVRGSAVATAALYAVALFLSASAPGWIGLGIALVLAAAVWATASGRTALAAPAAAAAAFALVVAPAAIVAPELVAPLTGRDAATLAATAQFRAEAWDRALDIWAVRPAAGHGPGQSSVRLSLAAQEDAQQAGLHSAQGLWAAALIDGGVIALSFWLALLGAALALALARLWRRPAFATAALAAAVTAGVAASLVAGDRLDLRVWLLVGLVAATNGAREILRG